MPWNLLLLPLAAGYYILTRHKRYKYLQQRLDRQRLIFDMVVQGIIILTATFIIKTLMFWLMPEKMELMLKKLPVHIPFFGTAFFSFVLAVGYTWVCNHTIYKDYKKQIDKAIKAVGNELELLLRDSVKHQKQLQFTLNSGKVYVAWAKELPIPTVSDNIRVIPVLSGYRDKKQNLKFTTHYLNVYGEFVKRGEMTNIRDHDVDLVIMFNSIVSVSYFDINMYETFKAKGGVK